MMGGSRRAERARRQQNLEGLKGIEGQGLRGVSVGGEERGAEDERHLVAMLGSGLRERGGGQGRPEQGQRRDEREGAHVQG
jgi:hypothetical protein